MRNDGGTKCLLAVIAAGLWGLLLVQITPPGLVGSAEASESLQVSVAQRPEKGLGGEHPRGRVPPTLPLRWRTLYAHDIQDAGGGRYCATVVTVRNLTAAQVNVDVEWVRWDGTQLAMRRLAVGAKRMLQWITSNGIDVSPHYGDDNANLAFLLGYARVYAADPRVLATSTLVCRAGTATGSPIYVHDTIATHPVGPTADYFQAGVPAEWTPSMVEPDVPE